MEFWVAVLVIVLLIRWRMIARRFDELRQIVEAQERQVSSLTARVFELERGRPAAPHAPAAAAAAEPEFQTVAEPEPAIAPYAAPEPEPPLGPAPVPAPAGESAIGIEPPPVPVAAAPSPPRDWEAVIGGSWLNALGILVLVIGLSLLLGLSLTSLGPAGKIAVGLAASLAMLGAGVWIERREKYALFGRGLIGGGWAALYFTVYAMHGLPAARVVESPAAGFALLLAVSAGMIAHSLGYRSQRVTTLAYFLAFATLHFTTLTGFAIAASLPLAASLAVLAFRFEWPLMAYTGMALAYGTYAIRWDPHTGSAFGQIALWVYWLTFESFDLAGLRSRAAARGLLRGILPFNAAAFVGVSLLTGDPQSKYAWLFFGLTALAYLGSALLRRSFSSEPPPEGPLERLLAGGFHSALVVAALTAVPSVWLRFDGWRGAFALLLLGQVFVLAGRGLYDPFFHRIAAGVFPVALWRLLLVEAPRTPHVTWGRLHFDGWAALALFAAGLFYLNRGLTRGGSLYTYAATALAMAAAATQLPGHWIGLAWFLLAAVLWECGLRLRLDELRTQAYAAGGLGLILTVAVYSFGVLAKSPPFWALAPAALVAYAITARAHMAEDDSLPPVEREAVLHFAALAGSILLGTFFWRLLPAPLIAIAWGAMGLALAEKGRSAGIPALVRNAHLVNAGAFGRLFLANFAVTGATGPISHRLLTAGPFVAMFAYLDRRLGVRLYSWGAVALAAALIRFELGRTLTVTGWAALSLALVWLGLSRANPELRLQGYLLAALTFFRGWATNFFTPESLPAMPLRVATGAFVILCFYAAEFLLPRAWDETGSVVDRYARQAFSLAASTLAALLLFFEISGGLLTVAWGFQGVVLLGAGFAARERILRLSGLALFLLCVLKLFLYDLRNLDLFNRTLSFIVLGLVLVGASWIYTRFREKIQRLL